MAIDASGMLMASSGRTLKTPGDSFIIHMDRRALGDVDLGRYNVKVTATTLVPDREIGWTVQGEGRPFIGHVFGYCLEPTGTAGTLVTSFCDWSGVSDEWRARDIFPVIPESTLKATLGILERTVMGERYLPPPR